LSAPHSTRAAPFVKTATGAAVFISCQQTPTDVGMSALNETDAFYVYGTCYKKLGGTQDGLTCKVYCETCDEWIYTEHVFGTLAHGYYKCVPTPPEYSPHRYHDVHAEGYDGGDYWGKSSTDTMDDGGLHLNIYEGQ
jgi:hypothetical protein